MLRSCRSFLFEYLILHMKAHTVCVGYIVVSLIHQSYFYISKLYVLLFCKSDKFYSKY
jgi:hypothetical protein